MLFCSTILFNSKFFQILKYTQYDNELSVIFPNKSCHSLSHRIKGGAQGWAVYFHFLIDCGTCDCQWKSFVNNIFQNGTTLVFSEAIGSNGSHQWNFGGRIPDVRTNCILKICCVTEIISNALNMYLEYGDIIGIQRVFPSSIRIRHWKTKIDTVTFDIKRTYLCKKWSIGKSSTTINSLRSMSSDAFSLVDQTGHSNASYAELNTKSSFVVRYLKA